MTKFISPNNKTYLSAEISYSKGDKIDQMNFNEIKKIVRKNLLEIGLVKNNEILDFSENKEDFVYPVQFTNYKYELSKITSNIAKFKQIYSLGTGGEFNYADSQILFHKSMDLVDTLNDKEGEKNQVTKPHYETHLNSEVKLGKNLVGQSQPVYIIAEAGLNHNGSVEIGKKIDFSCKEIWLQCCKISKFQFKKPCF